MTRVVYVILNLETGHAYAGLTSQFSRRMLDHQRQKPQLFEGRHSVLKTGPMADDVAQRFEARTIQFLKMVDFHTLNINRAGSLGGTESRWTKHRCVQEALRFSTRKAFEIAAKGAYTAAQRKGWLDDVCAHMERVINISGYWTKERCAEAALKYNSARQFLHGEGGAYVAARLNGWLQEICSHMSPRFRPKGYWTKERCTRAASEYATRSGFMSGAKSAYNMAHRNGWIDECCSHMTQVKRGPKPRCKT